MQHVYNNSERTKARARASTMGSPADAAEPREVRPLLAPDAPPTSSGVVHVEMPMNRMAAGDGPAAASSSEQAPMQHKVCRICFDVEDAAEAHDNPLISPCLCAGGSRYVHRKCLQQWRETSRGSGRAHAFYRCEVCHYEYKYTRLDGAAFLSHPVVIGSAFALLLLLSCSLLGFIPLVQACLAAYKISFTGPVHVVVHLLDGVILLGLFGFVLMSFCQPRGNCGDCAAHCPIYLCPDCTGAVAECTTAAAGGCGEVCGPILLVLLLGAAIVGLIGVIPAALRWLYQVFDQAAGATVAMVENVHSPQKTS